VPPARRIPISDRLAELFVQAILVSHGRGMSLHQAASNAAAFPFDVRLSATELRRSSQLRVCNCSPPMDFRRQM
jgi:hypothetical protein